MPYLSYSINRPGDFPSDWISAGRSWGRPYGIDYDRIPAIRCILWLGYPPFGCYLNPIYSICPIISAQSILQGRDLSYLLYAIPPRGSILWDGCIIGGVRRCSIELETAGYPMGGISYMALLSFGFRVNSYAVRWLSNP